MHMKEPAHVRVHTAAVRFGTKVFKCKVFECFVWFKSLQWCYSKSVGHHSVFTVLAGLVGLRKFLKLCRV